ncbi:BppU family phage baseplate upper protein [Clostridium sp.]|uniref:BppU family phage baseplate upper protein n=1 Tax=Clostridium sp. TaxID=1506 RepID=UPI0039925182
MAKKILNFTVDTIQSSYSPIGTVKQLDSVFFNITITENGAVKNLTGQTIKLFARKSDGKIVEQRTGINITGGTTGKVTIELLNSALQVAGFVTFELEISDSTGTISTTNFILKVQEKIANNKVIENTNEIGVLKEIEDYVAQAKREIQEFKLLKDDMVETNNTINTQEAARVQAENLRIEAELNREKSLKNLDELKTSYFGKEFDTPQERFLNEFEYLNNGEEKGSFLPFSTNKNHKIQESIEGKTRNMILEGETLQNLLGSSGTNIELVRANNGHHRQILKDLFKQGSYYTFIPMVRLIENVDNSAFIKIVYVDSTIVYKKFKEANSSQINNICLNFEKDIKELKVELHVDNQLDAKLTLDLIALEGDWTNKEIPSYFEGIKSIGQEENKISILSHGKNLFNLDKFKELLKTSLVEDVENGVIVNNGVRDLTTMVKFENKNYRFIYKREKIEGNGMSLFRVLYSNGTEKYLNGNDVFSGNNITKFEITYNNNGKTKLTDIILSDENNQNYEPYKQDKKDILIPFEGGLKGIGNIKDEIIDNKLIQRIGKVVFNGNETWNIRPTNLDKNTIAFFTNINNKKILNSYDFNGICNKFSVNDQRTFERDVESVVFDGWNTQVSIQILKSKLTTHDIECLKKWLKNNPTTIYYELANPIEYDLTNIDLNLNTYEDLTYITTEATSTFYAPVTISNTIARLNRENKTLEKENIELKKDTKLLASAMLNILEPMLLPNGEIDNSNLELLKELNKIVEN